MSEYVQGPGPLSEPGPPAFPTAPPPKKSRKALWITLSAVVVVIVVCGAYLVVRMLPYLREGNATLSTPQSVAGLTLSTRPELQALAEQLTRGMRRAIPSTDSAMGAFYDDPDDDSKIVMVAGVTGSFSDPASELEKGLNGASSAGISVENFHDVEPGPLGGVARCGSGKAGRQDFVVCAWADHGSAAMVIFFNREAAESERMFREIRGAILHRG